MTTSTISKVRQSPSLSQVLHLPKLIQNTNIDIEKRDRIGISTMDGIEILYLEEILYCMAEGNYCRIICKDGREILASKTLRAVATGMSEGEFLRTHQSYLVSVKEIKRIRHNSLLLKDGTNIPIARTRKTIVMKYFRKMIYVV